MDSPIHLRRDTGMIETSGEMVDVRCTVNRLLYLLHVGNFTANYRDRFPKLCMGTDVLEKSAFYRINSPTCWKNRHSTFFVTCEYAHRLLLSYQFLYQCRAEKACCARYQDGHDRVPEKPFTLIAFSGQAS